MASTSSFFTDEVFRSREDLMTWVQNMARSLGFVIVITRSRTNRLGYTSKVVLGCERGGESRSKKREITNDPTKDFGTKKINCPFELVGKYSKTHGVWELRVIRDIHNHPPALYMEGHAYAMRLSDNETRMVQDLTRLNVKPRDILTTLKKQNENNVSSLKTVYNARYKFRLDEQAGRTPMQNLMYILQSKGYIFQVHKNKITNELEELFFIHPTSLSIWQAFPNVVLMDATYKTNKYNLPFLEIVGVASTNKSFCIAFAFMSKEKTNNYIWALQCLKLTIKASFSPRVIVTNRDLALMKACAEVFPQSNHLLCRWHIETDITKHCKPRIKSYKTWVSFLRMWNALIVSPTNTAYVQNYADLKALLYDYPVVLSYLHTVWLDSFAEKFVSVWTDKHLNFGNSTTNRVESQHAKLKKHLDSTKCDLDRFILIIEDVVKSQETAVKESLERSRIFRKPKYNKPIFKQLHGFVSHHAMEKLLAEVDRSQGFVLTLDTCGCQLRSSFGLPCAHELAMYVNTGLSIPLNCIDPFWTKLDLLPSIDVDYGDLGYASNMKMFQETYNKQSKPVKHDLLKKIHGVFDPLTNLIVEPAVKKNNRGRPKIKHVDPTTRVHNRHSFSNTSDFSRVIFNNINQEPARHSSFFMGSNKESTEQSCYLIDLNEEPSEHRLMKEIPEIFHPYITCVQDVMGDGNCGFRAVAACLGYGENQWLYIREQLLDELLNAYNAYEKILTTGINEVHTSLSCSSSPPPSKHWMVMPETGILIANRFGVILHCLSNQGCVTCFPFWKGPEEFQHHKMITVAHVYGNHYVMVQLEGEYPMPCISAYYVRHKAPSAVGWQTMYIRRLELYKQLMPCKLDKTFIHIED